MDQKMYLPQKNHEAFNEVYARMCGGEVIQVVPGLSTHLTEGFFYRRNYIAPSADADIRGIVETIIENTKKGYPSLTTITPELLPDGTEQILTEMGFELIVPEYGMVYEMGSCQMDQATDPNIDVIYKDEISLWVDAMVEGFREENKVREDVVFESLVRSPEMTFFGYRLDGRIAGTAILYDSEEYAGIYEIAVPKQYRRNGIASALVRHLLKMIESRGSRGAILQASPMGKPVYEKIGFRQVCRMDQYLLKR